jgi:hypothetical protein
MTTQENKDQSINQREGSISNYAKVDISERTLSVIALVFSSIGIVISIFTLLETWSLAREAKQVQIQLMYANAIMLREGMVQPGDQVYGPEGNLEYRQHELRRKEK